MPMTRGVVIFVSGSEDGSEIYFVATYDQNRKGKKNSSEINAEP